ncbi:MULTISPECIES: PilZ domain-containing protein [Halomonadaceae]|uniref:PilZ domain-containing protein n=1 Tax=Halomonadaceae TaxID=28256 RepID=UPI00109FB5E9|nr:MULTISPECIES: PilZ domain-containing protein [Halomonas]
MAGQKALSLTIQDLPTLLSAYMPSLVRGGIFVPTRERYTLDQEILLLLTLPGDEERYPVTGQVVWVSPPGVSGRRVPGVGLHFRAEDQSVRDRIETLLAGQLDKGATTYTL